MSRIQTLASEPDPLCVQQGSVESTCRWFKQAWGLKPDLHTLPGIFSYLCTRAQISSVTSVDPRA